MPNTLPRMHMEPCYRPAEHVPRVPLIFQSQTQMPNVGLKDARIRVSLTSHTLPGPAALQGVPLHALLGVLTSVVPSA